MKDSGCLAAAADEAVDVDGASALSVIEATTGCVQLQLAPADDIMAINNWHVGIPCPPPPMRMILSLPAKRAIAQLFLYRLSVGKYELASWSKWPLKGD